MNDEIKEAFGSIRAEEALKDSTRAFIVKKTHGYTKNTALRRGFYACAASCACLLILLFGGFWLYFTPVSEICIDINPSLEMSINRFDRVIDLKGFNEDGRELAKTLNVNFMRYTQAVELILQNEKISELLADNETMAITVTGSDGTRASEILSRLEECTSYHENAYCCYFPSEQAQGAHSVGLSCGRYRLYLQLKSLGSDISPEEVGNMSVNEIEGLIDSLGGDTTVISGEDTGHGQHHNHHGK